MAEAGEQGAGRTEWHIPNAVGAVIESQSQVRLNQERSDRESPRPRDRSGAGNGGGHMPSATHRNHLKLISMLNPWAGENHPMEQIKGALTVTVKTGPMEIGRAHV